MDDIAHYAAPMLWFSPDEEKLRNDIDEKLLPNSFPFDLNKNRVVYYKFKQIYTTDKTIQFSDTDTDKAFDILDLKKIKAFSVEYYYYFASESGLGSHPHDIESVSFQLEVNQVKNCDKYKYQISVIRIIGRAHGVSWFDHVLDVDSQTFFPASILIEEGKHASITDKNADGIYTSTYDVTRRVNDAWGARDIISSGKLVNGGFQAWMAKVRLKRDIVHPPVPYNHPYISMYEKKFGKLSKLDKYTLKPYPDYPRVGLDNTLNIKMKEKKFHDWPNVKYSKPKGNVNQWRREDNAFRSLSLAYRWDDSNGITLVAPLLFFKTVEAPMTGGWLVNKFSFGLGESDFTGNNFIFEKLFGHQILHSSSASRWIDTYVGLGYEIYDVDTSGDGIKYETFFSSEAGIKIRLNITKTPLKFLKHLGTEYWGVRIGWKNTGFHPFINSGFIVEIGAGVF